MSSRLASCTLVSLTKRVGHMSLGGSRIQSQPLVTLGTAANNTLLTVASSSRSFGTGSNSGSHQRWIVPPSNAPSFASTTSLMPPFRGGVLESMGSPSSSSMCGSPVLQIHRTFATRKKRLEKRRKRRLAEKAAARKLEEKATAGPGAEEEQAAPQHEAWVDFQKSISVAGFQTGQTTKARVQKKGEIGQKLRDLKRKEKLEMRMASKRPELADVRGGEYPVKRYSDEETERLLAMAYASIPPRAGKRGTRNLKRQKRRWFLVYKIRRKYKNHIIQAHFRRMEERSQRMKAIKAVKAEAPDVRAKDRKYQQTVLRRWVENLQKHDDDYAGRELIQAEASVIQQNSKVSKQYYKE